MDEEAAIRANLQLFPESGTVWAAFMRV
jgi:hypothetical protein